MQIIIFAIVSIINSLVVKMMWEGKSLPPFHLKTGAPSRANFREIEQGDSPEYPQYSGKI